MQCPSCRFENMPGLDACGRCGTVLDLDSLAIDVNPPRASRAARRLRRMVPRRAIYTARRDTAAEAGRILRGRVVDEARVPLPEPAILARLGVPGWAHMYAGLDLRGRAFLGAYLFFLALGLFRWGTEFGSIFLGLAFSVHASSVIDVLIRQGTVRFPRMLSTAALVFLTLGGVYYPAIRALSRVASPIAFYEDAAPFARYDVVLVNRWAFAMRSPRPGDVVLFRPSWPGRTPAGYNLPHARLVVEENVLIDRVVGGPGDRVRWERGRLTVNGEPVPWEPLVPRVLPEALEITVPAGLYLVLPTSSRASQAGRLGTDWTAVSLIRPGDIEGGAFLRPSPLRRWWFIR